MLRNIKKIYKDTFKNNKNILKIKRNILKKRYKNILKIMNF